MILISAFAERTRRISRQPITERIYTIAEFSNNQPVSLRGEPIHLADQTRRDLHGARSIERRFLPAGFVRGLINSEVFRSLRSEERRVGKECRSRWSPYH